LLEQNTVNTPEFITSQVRVTPKGITHLALIFISEKTKSKIAKLQKGN
jgi:hypothetical protein